MKTVWILEKVKHYRSRRSEREIIGIYSTRDGAMTMRSQIDHLPLGDWDRFEIEEWDLDPAHMSDNALLKRCCAQQFDGAEWSPDVDDTEPECRACRDDEPLPTGHGAPAGASQGVAGAQDSQAAINDPLARQSLPDDIDRAIDKLV